MTRPRIVDPGATLALSRRTTRRHFLLHPDEARQMEQVYWYCLAYAAQLHGVLVHAACLMSADRRYKGGLGCTATRHNILYRVIRTRE
jgi:hypothetical protein